MDSKPLQLYGGVVQSAIAEILAIRRGPVQQALAEISTTRHRDPEDYSQIPLSSYTGYFAKNPLPPIFIDGSKAAHDANRIVDFINGTDDILNLKRGLRELLRIAGNEGWKSLFPEDRFHPDLLEISEAEEEK